jgi:hypothetical protein
MGRVVCATPPRFDSRGQNVNRTGTGGRSATDRERDGQSGEGQQSHGEADGGGAIPCPSGSHRPTRVEKVVFYLYRCQRATGAGTPGAEPFAAPSENRRTNPDADPSADPIADPRTNPVANPRKCRMKPYPAIRSRASRSFSSCSRRRAWKLSSVRQAER